MFKVAWTDAYVLPLPPHHRFPMSKYEVLPQQLLHEGTLTSQNIFHPSPIARELVLLTHEETYLEKLETLSLSPQEVRRTGFPLHKKVVDRELLIVNGTLECARYALQYGVAMNIAGGTHHAFTNRGGGFCRFPNFPFGSEHFLFILEAY